LFGPSAALILTNASPAILHCLITFLVGVTITAYREGRSIALAWSSPLSNYFACNAEFRFELDKERYDELKHERDEG